MASCVDLREEEVCAYLKKLAFLAFLEGNLGDCAVWTIQKLVFNLRLEHKPDKLGEQTQQNQSRKHTKGCLP